MMDIFAHTFLLEGQRGQDCCVWRWGASEETELTRVDLCWGKARNEAGNGAAGLAVSLGSDSSPGLTFSGSEWRTVMRMKGLITFGNFL